MTPQDAVTETKSSGRSGRRRAFDQADVSKLFEKLPPHAAEAEMSLLGAMLMEPAVIGDVVQILRDGGDFFSGSNGVLFDVIVELYDRHSSLDLVQLHQTLIDRDLLGTIGGQEYLVDLAESVPTAAHALHYAKLVRDKAIVRHLIHVAGEIIHESHHNPGDAQSILDECEQKIFTIAERYESSEFESLGELLDELRDRVYSREMPAPGLRTGFYDMDRMTGGLQPGELLILAARPSMGKTALALNIAEQVSMENRSSIAFFSLEMSKDQLVQRLVAGRCGVDVQKLRQNMLNEAERASVRDACVQLRDETNILVDDTPALTLLQLRAKARRMVAKHEAKAIFVDYLQLLNASGSAESRQVEVSQLSRGLKALARELSVPVVCLSQLNRGPEQREGHKPRLSDLRESGAIEQDADVVFLLHREDYYHKEDEHWEPTHVAEVIIAKQRNGPTGLVKLRWDSGSTRFTNLTYIAGDDYEGMS